ncbi:hypothetical protein AMTR_s00105p00077580 [Amborella trichopoda]|uniref:Uncharacterized protein n=1 Tax=Amborella trichopoda TaxID=13333 RepID=W1NXQ2_AMBTC|nr:hypothetical protein AMTR_s00105p00077580 [Amborella trichopoda]
MDLIDKRERRDSKITQAESLMRPKSCSETRVLSKASFSLKVNRPMGGSMRHTDPNSIPASFRYLAPFRSMQEPLISRQEIGQTIQMEAGASISAVSHPLLLRHLDWPEKSPVTRFLTDFGKKGHVTRPRWAHGPEATEPTKPC